MKRILQEIALHAIGVGLITLVMTTMTLAVVLECHAVDRQWDRAVAK